MTHGPRRIDKDPIDSMSMLWGEHCGCPHLKRVVKTCRTKLHCFGHIHEGYGAQVVDRNQEDQLNLPQIASDNVIDTSGQTLETRQTLLINAASPSVEEDERKPWLVDIDLKRLMNSRGWRR